MKELISSNESKKFVIIWLWVCFVWFSIGSLIHWLFNFQVIAFIQIFLFSWLDLVFLILLFWELFFKNPDKNTQLYRGIRISLFGFFKLVCLAFLAITLKRLRNASLVSQIMGVSTIWITPFVSGLILKYFINSSKNKV